MKQDTKNQRKNIVKRLQTMVSDSRQDLQNQEVNEVSKRHIFGQYLDLRRLLKKNQNANTYGIFCSNTKSIINYAYILFIVPTLSNWEQITVIFFPVILKNAKMSSSTAKNSFKMLKEKFMNISETDKCILVFPEAFEQLIEVSKGSKILIPLLSMVKPSAFAFISMVSPFKTSL